MVALEQVMDAVTAIALSVSRGAPGPSPEAVRMLSSTLRAASSAAATRGPAPATASLPDDEPLRPATEAVQALLGVLGTGERLTTEGSNA